MQVTGSSQWVSRLHAVVRHFVKRFCHLLRWIRHSRKVSAISSTHLQFPRNKCHLCNISTILVTVLGQLCNVSANLFILACQFPPVARCASSRFQTVPFAATDKLFCRLFSWRSQVQGAHSPPSFSHERTPGV